MNQSPKQKYNDALAAGEIKPNEPQRKVIDRLDTIYHQLIHRQRIRNHALGKLRRKIKPRKPIHGLYLWGSVGVGKTFLMDLFYDALPTTKIRMHFHEFMNFVHNELTRLQGTKNPLKVIAKKFADEHVVLCLDEFFVSDITDAMLLATLFDALFKGGICLITSSNIEPDGLYKDGLQRERFLPAIKLIKKYTDTFHLEAGEDFRLRHIKEAGVYYTPLNETANKHLEKSFQLFSNGATINTQPIELFHRPINIIKQADKIIWFDFMAICGRPRSQTDYLAIAQMYDTILISDIHVINASENNLIISFINLIDVLYDAHVRVIISAADIPEKLYTQGRYHFEFARTVSRLIEMQSNDYFFSFNS